MIIRMHETTTSSPFLNVHVHITLILNVERRGFDFTCHMIDYILGYSTMSTFNMHSLHWSRWLTMFTLGYLELACPGGQEPNIFDQSQQKANLGHAPLVPQPLAEEAHHRQWVTTYTLSTRLLKRVAVLLVLLQSNESCLQRLLHFPLQNARQTPKYIQINSF